jgi:hypothetical protein
MLGDVRLVDSYAYHTHVAIVYSSKQAVGNGVALLRVFSRHMLVDVMYPQPMSLLSVVTMCKQVSNYTGSIEKT